MSNIAKNESGYAAPASITLPYWSTYFWIPEGKTYRQTKPVLGNQWEEIKTGSGDGIPEAPVDGKQYGRQDGEWTEVTGGGVDLPYSLYTSKITAIRIFGDGTAGFPSFEIGKEYIINDVANGGTGIYETTTETLIPFTSTAQLFVIGNTYRTLFADPFFPFGADFANIGWVADNVDFVATGTTPTTWGTMPALGVSEVVIENLIDDLTNVGFVSLNTPFIATGTTPTLWRQTLAINVTDSESSSNVLQDTIGNITLEEGGGVNTGFWLDIKSPGLFVNEKTWLSSGARGTINQQGGNIVWIDVNTLRLRAINISEVGVYPDVDLDIEIRIYN